MLDTIQLFFDEIIYSFFSRYHFLSGNLNWSDTSKELFGKVKVCPNLYYPIRLNYFCKQILPQVGLNPEYIINKHTLFPLYKPFLTIKESKELTMAMKSGNANGLLLKIDLYTDNNSKKDYVYKICSECYLEDRKNSVPYLHRNHQVPGNLVCHKHKKILTIYQMPIEPKQRAFIDICSHNRKGDNLYLSDVLINHYYRISKSGSIYLTEGSVN